MVGREVRVPWRDTTVRAWLPEPLATRAPVLRESTVRATERASAAALTLGNRIPTGFEPVARLLLRAEGLASSNVEGVNAPIVEIAIAEEAGGTGVARHVADNLAVVTEALDHASSGESLSVDDLHRWHTRLMLASTLPQRFVGTWRDEVGWIGGTSPAAAVFVPAPPDAIDDLMRDLIDVANNRPWDPVTTAALVHAQFETIHPYGDGNGRLGRVLSLWLLARGLDGVTVPPPMSVLVARDTDAYIAALGAFRIGLDDQLVDWFASTLVAAGTASLAWAEELETLLSRWRSLTASLRADAAGHGVIDMLGEHPVLNVDVVAGALGVSRPAARNGLQTLCDLGILDDLGPIAVGPGRPRRWWSATELLDLAARWALP